MIYLNIIKNIVKKSRYGSYLFSFFPKSVLYTKSYTEVIKLRKLENQDNIELVDIFLRKKMVNLLQEALKNVPWYRNNVKIDYKLINESNVYKMLGKFPFIDKKIIMDNWSDFINDKYKLNKLKIGATEGTSGQGLKIASSRAELGAHRAFIESEVKCINFDIIKTKTIRIAVEGLKNIDDIPFDRFGNRLLISPAHLKFKWFNIIYTECNKFKASVIHAYPTLLFMLAQYIVDNNLPPIKVKLLLLSSDIFMYHHYKFFMKAFDSPEIISVYNMSEHVALGFSIINKQHEKISYQLDRIYSFNENLKDEYGRQEIVGTSYWNEAMPLIRYRTQDFGLIDCNSFIDNLDGRGETFVTSKYGDKISGIILTDFEEYIWKYIHSFQLVQKRAGIIIIRLVVKDCFTEEVGERIVSDMYRNWNNSFDFQIEIVDKIEKGKSTKIRTVVVDL